ncbi:MAG: LytR/AlgR family response regulator transcription factor [Chitinophagaceae bacterium]
MKVVIIEDELPAANQLRSELEQMEEQIEVLAILSSVADAKRWLQQNPAPDLLFMDISLGDGLSFRLFEEGPPACPVIFTTAFDEYWQQAFEYHGIDYLLKPLRTEKLAAAIKKMHSFRKLFTASDVLAIQQPVHATAAFRKRFLVKKGVDYCSIRTDEVAYFYATHKLVCLVSKEGQKFLLDQSLAEIEKQMDPTQFFRLNRKYLVQLSAITRIIAHYKGKLQVELSPMAPEEVVVSAETSAAFKAWIDQ